MKDLEETVIESVREIVEKVPGIGNLTFSKLHEQSMNLHGHISNTSEITKTAVEFAGFENGSSTHNETYKKASEIGQSILLESAGRFIELMARQLKSQDIPFPKDYQLMQSFEENPPAPGDIVVENNLDAVHDPNIFYAAEYDNMFKTVRKELSELMSSKPSTSKEIESLSNFAVKAFIDQIEKYKLDLDEETISEMGQRLYCGVQIGIVEMYSIFEQYANSSRLYRMEDFKPETINAMRQRHHTEGLFGGDIVDMMEDYHDVIKGQIWSFTNIVKVAMINATQEYEVKMHAIDASREFNGPDYNRLVGVAESCFEEAAGRLFYLMNVNMELEGKQLPRDQENPLICQQMEDDNNAEDKYETKTTQEIEDSNEQHYTIKDDDGTPLFSVAFSPDKFENKIFQESLNFLTIYQGSHPATCDSILGIASICTDIFKKHMADEHSWLEQEGKDIFDSRLYMATIVGLTNLYQSVKDYAKYATKLE